MRQNECLLRPATIDDAKMILDWVNDPLDRANSFSSEEITYEEHMAWFTRALKDPTKYLYVMVCEDHDIGHIKLYVNDDIAEIGYCIAPEWRGRGYAKTIVKLIIRETEEHIPQIKKLIGQVKQENIPSRKAFIGAGFSEEAIVYSLDIGDTENELDQ